MKYIHAIFFLLFIATHAATAQSSIRNGKDYAVFFFVTDFDNGWQRLPKTENEMMDISRELQNNYGFQCDTVKNPSLQTILDVLQRYESINYGADDQILFFFSMHGNYDEKVKKAYLIPKTGGYGMRDYRSWLSYSDLSQELSFVNCNHIYLALDACFSGAFGDRHRTKPTELAFDADLPCAENIGKILKKKSRIYATSGGIVRVPDESKFAKRFLDALVLVGKDGVVSDRDIIYQISSIKGPIEPEYGTFEGDDRGSFLFVRNNACAKQTVTTMNQPNNDMANRPNTNQGQDNDNGGYTPPQSLPPSVSRLPFEPVMEKVYGGTFQMGSSDSNAPNKEKPLHPVQVDDFFIGKYEVTFDEYDIFCDSTGIVNPLDNGWGRGKRPVINVSWEDATRYCEWLSKKTGKNYRLPTEAEWEFAARGGESYMYSGSNTLKDVGIYKGHSNNMTESIGQRQANGFGLHDMSGNVWEWCSDWFNENSYSNSVVKNPTGVLNGTGHVIRGGGWQTESQACSVTFRDSAMPRDKSYALGFRIVRSK